MLLRLLSLAILVALSTSQNAPSEAKTDTKQNQDAKPLVLLATPLNQSQNQKVNVVPQEIEQLYSNQQLPPELYGLTYLQPQYQAESSLPRLQPQIVLYGPGGQGQPILINPGNPPGNFLIPQGPGPNVILRNNPQGSTGPLFPVAGYPKPAHIPPIEKDAEEVPTNPAKIPPLQTEGATSTNKPKPKPEKLETFTEPNLPDQNTRNGGQFPQTGPESVSLRPGQRFFILNGDQIYNYPFEAQGVDLPALRYTSVQPFPQNPPKFLHPFAQEPPQFLQGGEGQLPQAPISVPNHLLRNSFGNPQSEPQQNLQPSTELADQRQKNQDDGALKTAQQYFRAAPLPGNPDYFQNPQGYQQNYFVDQQGAILNQQLQDLQNIRHLPPKGDVVQPQVIGQFRFTPEGTPGFYQFKDDLENDAVVVDASFDAPESYNQRIGNDKEDENVTSTASPPSSETESEPSMAQAGPQATAIAGPGGVAGSGPRGTAIVGKGGLAVSSPQATAVAGTKDEEKKRRPVKKNQ